MGLNYFLGKALSSLRESPGVSLVTTATIAASLIVLGLYFAGLQNVENLAVLWGRSASVTAYVADGLTDEDHETMRGDLASIEGVERAQIVTPKQALSAFRARGPNENALVAGVEEDLLPTSIELDLTGGFADLDQLAAIAAKAGEVRGVNDIDYGAEEFDRLQVVVETLRSVGIAAGILFALATAFIIANTIRLTVYARRDEIAILRLVGATHWFVRLPFLFEGAIWGFMGGFLGILALWLGDLYLAPAISVAIAGTIGSFDVHLFSPDVGIGLLIGGVTLGVAGSALAVRRFLDVGAL